MTNEFYIMLAAHLVIFFWVRRKLNKKKKQLQKENAELYVQGLQLESKVAYYEQLMRERG